MSLKRFQGRSLADMVRAANLAKQAEWIEPCIFDFLELRIGNWLDTYKWQFQQGLPFTDGSGQKYRTWADITESEIDYQRMSPTSIEYWLFPNPELCEGGFCIDLSLDFHFLIVRNEFKVVVKISNGHDHGPIFTNRDGTKTDTVVLNPFIVQAQTKMYDDINTRINCRLLWSRTPQIPTLLKHDIFEFVGLEYTDVRSTDQIEAEKLEEYHKECKRLECYEQVAMRQADTTIVDDSQCAIS